jgi:DNA polymerase-3 subunit alpha
VEARDAGGPFKSLYDFTERVDSRAVNKRVLEGLIRGGAFDLLGKHRAQIFAAIDSAIEGGQRIQRSRASGQADLFGTLLGSMPEAEPPLPDAPEWSHHEMLSGEKETLGFYISGHPLLRYEEALKDFTNADVDRLSGLQHSAQVVLGGIVMGLNVRTTKKGDRFALLQLEDQFGSVKVVAWPDVFGKANGHLQNETPVLVRGRLEIDDGGSMTIIAEEVEPLENIRERLARTVVVHVNGESLNDEKVVSLQKLLDRNRGDSGVIFEIELPNRMIVRVQPNQFVRVKVTNELTTAIQDLLGECRVELMVQRASTAAR